MSTDNFILPIFGTGINISATTTSASASFVTNIYDRIHMLLLTNSGSSTVYVRWGIGAQTALTSDFCIPTGKTAQVRIGVDGIITFAAITLAGTATLSCSYGSKN